MSTLSLTHHLKSIFRFWPHLKNWFLIFFFLRQIKVCFNFYFHLFSMKLFIFLITEGKTMFILFWDVLSSNHFLSSEFVLFFLSFIYIWLLKCRTDCSLNTPRLKTINKPLKENFWLKTLSHVFRVINSSYTHCRWCKAFFPLKLCVWCQFRWHISRLRFKDNDPLSYQICVYCNGKSIFIVWVYIR